MSKERYCPECGHQLNVIITQAPKGLPENLPSSSALAGGLAGGIFGAVIGFVAGSVMSEVIEERENVETKICSNCGYVKT